ncbi:hypothetical protein VTL71DRAFT_9234 [Oculimacula yallundae]|uniref:Auxiliary Activity family 9 catalytic domain-containing protein n=1 Tax=Oculimacula yallundae TaxID=86028 RepID=A0ABR4BV63_9HELO
MPAMMNTVLFGLLATASKVAAHGFVDEIKVDGKSFTGYLVNQYSYMATAPQSVGWSEKATDLGFVGPQQYASGDIICHKEAKNAAISAPVKAGGKVDLHWNTWPASHKGPVINYMANCGGSCATVDKSTLKFFKISESGLLDNSAAPGEWASDALMANNLTGSVTIPTNIAAGNYVLRHEMIALHSAGDVNGAQNYPFCVNLEVSGSGTDKPEGVLGTALYTATDPGIKFNLYVAGAKYTIPGPPVISGAGSGSAAPASPAAPAPVVSSSKAPGATGAPVPSAAPTTLQTSVKPAATPAPVQNAPAPGNDDDSCE